MNQLFFKYFFWQYFTMAYTECFRHRKCGQLLHCIHTSMFAWYPERCRTACAVTDMRCWFRRDTQGNLVQDPMVSLAPDGIVSTMGGGLSGLGGASAMHGTLNLAPPHLMPKSTGNAAEGTSQVNNDRAIVPSQLSKAGGAVSPEDPSLLAKPLVGSPQTQERVTQLEKELQIERESSQAAIVALKQQLDVEKESSKTAIAQVRFFCKSRMHFFVVEKF